MTIKILVIYLRLNMAHEAVDNLKSGFSRLGEGVWWAVKHAIVPATLMTHVEGEDFFGVIAHRENRELLFWQLFRVAVSVAVTVVSLDIAKDPGPLKNIADWTVKLETVFALLGTVDLGLLTIGLWGAGHFDKKRK